MCRNHGFGMAFGTANGRMAMETSPEERERVFEDEQLAPGVNTLTFSTPARLSPGAVMRFRFSRGGGLGPTGTAPDGEVEDHLVPIAPARRRR